MKGPRRWWQDTMELADELRRAERFGMETWRRSDIRRQARRQARQCPRLTAAQYARLLIIEWQRGLAERRL